MRPQRVSGNRRVPTAKPAKAGDAYETMVDRLRRIRQGIRDIRSASKSSDNAQVAAKSALVREAMREIDLDILPSIRAMADPIAFVLPTSIEWVGWEALRITDTEEEFLEHILDLSHAGLDDALLVLLGMLGPHLRQQSDEVDCAILPLLLATAFRRLDAALESGKLETIGRDRCRRHFQRRSFQSGLFPFPGSSAAASTIRFRNIPEMEFWLP